MKKYIRHIFAVGLVLLTPLVSYAAPLTGLKDLLTAFGGILNLGIKVLITLAIVYFFWGLGQFILHAGDAKSREEGKQKILWGIIALFVMLSLFGIISFISTVTGIPTPVNSSTAVQSCIVNPNQPGC